MTPTRGTAAAAMALALLACNASGSGSHRLAIAGPRWTLSGLDVRLGVSATGALAEYDSTLVVAVGNKVVGRVATDRGAARVVVPADALRAGENRILVKTGSESSELTVRVVPAAYVATPTAALALGALALAVRRRRRLSAARR